MTRVVLLRAGYIGLGLAFLLGAASTLAPAFVLLGAAVAFLACLALLFSRDDVPRWAGLALLGYFVVTIAMFVFSSSVTFRSGGSGYHIDATSPGLAQAIFDDLVIVGPFVLGGAALAATWERERPVRILMVGALVGFLLVALLTVVLRVPPPSDPKDAAAVLNAQQAAAAQAKLLLALGGISSLAAAVGTFWAAARPEEFA